MMRKIFLLLVAMVMHGMTCSVEAAFVFYKTRGTTFDVSFEEMEKLMAIVAKYQYPMSLAHFQDPLTTDSGRLKDIMYLRHHTEAEFINKKIQEYSDGQGNPLKDIRAVFIPDTYYQFFYLYEYFSDNEVRTILKKLSARMEKSISRIDYQGYMGHDFDMSTFYKMFNDFHHGKDFIALFAAMNTNLLLLLSSSPKYLSREDLSEDVYRFTLHEENVYADLEKLIHGGLKVLSSNMQGSLAERENLEINEESALSTLLEQGKMIAKVALLEVEQFFQGNVLLYRGTSLLEGGVVDSIAQVQSIEAESMNNSVSYGMSLLGGILRDATACALSHIVKPRKNFGYALPLKLADLYNNKYNFIYAPAFNPLITIDIPMGEFWHARTKIGAFGPKVIKSNQNAKIKVAGVAFDEVGKNEINQGVIVYPIESLKLAARYSQYLEDNIIVLRDDSRGVDWHKAQREHTALIENLIQIRAYSRNPKFAKIHKKEMGKHKKEQEDKKVKKRFKGEKEDDEKEKEKETGGKYY